MLTQPKGLDDEGEGNKANEHDVEFLEPGRDASESLQPSEKTFHFIVPFVHGPVVFPRFDAVGFWRHDRIKSEIQAN